MAKAGYGGQALTGARVEIYRGRRTMQLALHFLGLRELARLATLTQSSGARL